MYAVAFWLLLLIGHIGLADVVLFHGVAQRVPWRAASRREARVHAVRHVVYGLQFLWLPAVQLHGDYVWALAPLYALDVTAAWVDVWIERDSRAELGGLPRGEYLLHIVLSFLVGMKFLALAQVAVGWHALPDAIVWAGPPVPLAARVLCGGMGVTALALGLWGLARRGAA